MTALNSEDWHEPSLATPVHAENNCMSTIVSGVYI